MKKARFLIVTILSILFCFSLVSPNGISQEPTHLYLQPSDPSISEGDNFEMIIQLNTTASIGGWALSIEYNPNYIYAMNVSPGSYWEDLFDKGNINNTEGTISLIQTWTTGPYPNETHVLCTITFNAKKDGITTIHPSYVNVSTSSLEFLTIQPVNKTIYINPIKQHNGDSSHSPSDDSHDTEPLDTDTQDNSSSPPGSSDQGNTTIDTDDTTTGDEIIDTIQNVLGISSEAIIDIYPLPDPLQPFFIIVYASNDSTAYVLFNTTTNMNYPMKKISEDTYYIDTDDDRHWDYTYDHTTGNLTPYTQPKKDGITLTLLLLVTGMGMVFLILTYIVVKYKRK